MTPFILAFLYFAKSKTYGYALRNPIRIILAPPFQFPMKNDIAIDQLRFPGDHHLP
jgi:hypothetical protein